MAGSAEFETVSDSRLRHADTDRQVSDVREWQRRISMGSFTALLLLSAAMYMRGAAAAEEQPDYRKAGEASAGDRLANGGGHDGGAADEEMEAALLRGEGSSGPVQ